MTGTTRSSDGLEARRKQVLFRAWHRGIREMDLIMGPFADATIGELTDGEIGEFERLIELPDQQLLAWIMGDGPVPHEHDGVLFRRMRDFTRNRRA